MTSLAAIAYAAMLTLAQPGHDIGSRLDLVEEPTAIELQEDTSIRRPGFKFMRATWAGWSRGETEAEAIERWATIANAVARVANDPPKEWRWTSELGRLQLARAVVTIWRHEGGEYWRAVHEGRLRGKLGEVCGLQVRPIVARQFGIDPESLVGIDAEATERCVRAGVLILAKSRNLAERRCSGQHWFSPTVAAYGSGKGCAPCPGGEWAKGVEARERTYVRTGMRKPLPDMAREILEAG